MVSTRDIEGRDRFRWRDECRERGKSEQQRRRRGLAGLPVPPKSWDYLLLQSTVAQQKQREQQNYTHLPSAALPTLAHVDYNCASSHPNYDKR